MLTFSVQIHDRDEKLNGRPVTQIVSRLDEDRNKFDVSRRVYERLQEATAWSSNEVTFNDAREFISNPILQRNDNPSSFSNTIRAIGISEADIRFSEEYEAEVRTALEPMITEYLNRVDELSLIFDTPQYEQNKRSLDSHLKNI
jgi:hypothetical protein